MTEPLYIAVDLGAGSGRVFLAAFDERGLLLQEISRFHYPPTVVAGRLRWNLPKIFLEIREGIRIAGARARELGRSIQSIGVESWGVDYGLFGADGKLVEWPICYRDDRTQGMMEQVFALVPRAEIFARTGIQFLPITLFQLYAHAREGFPPKLKAAADSRRDQNFYLTGKCGQVHERNHDADVRCANREMGPRLPIAGSACTSFGWRIAGR